MAWWARSITCALKERAICARRAGPAFRSISTWTRSVSGSVSAERASIAERILLPPLLVVAVVVGEVRQVPEPRGRLAVDERRRLGIEHEGGVLLAQQPRQLPEVLEPRGRSASGQDAVVHEGGREDAHGLPAGPAVDEGHQVEEQGGVPGRVGREWADHEAAPLAPEDVPGLALAGGHSQPPVDDLALVRGEAEVLGLFGGFFGHLRLQLLVVVIEER